MESDLRAGPREWIGLAALALPTLLVSVDMTVVYLALPQLGADLQPSSSQLLWITDIYGFIVAGFLITMGTLGDRIGRRKLLMLGGVAFGISSALAAYSVSAEMLIATRALMGIAGATLMPSVLALVSNLFRDPRERAFAIAVWMTIYSVGMAIGPLLGGVVLELFWWGSVFLLNVPVMLLLLVTAPLLLPEYRDTTAGRLDLFSVVLSLGAILPIIYGIKRFAESGVEFSSILAIVAGLIVGVAFAHRQRTLDNSLLDMSLFRNSAFSSAVAILLLVLMVFGGIYLFFAQYLQLVEGLSPLRAGLWMLPSVVGIVIGNMAAPIIARRVRPAYVCGIGLIAAAMGSLLFTQVDSVSGLTMLTVGSVIALFGLSPTMVLGIDLIVGTVPPEKAGSAASVSETSGELGFALGVATLGTVGTAIYRGQLADSMPSDASPTVAEAARDSLAGATAEAERLPFALGAELLDAAKEAFTSGLNVVGAVSGVASAGLAVLAMVLLRHVRPSADVAGAQEAAAESDTFPASPGEPPGIPRITGCNTNY